MTPAQIVAYRLTQQKLVGKAATSPVEVVRLLCAVQSQDFYGAKWALGQRSNSSDDTVEKAFNAGKILRTHVLRPTWHFVLPEDIRWMLSLTAPRIHAANQAMCRKLGLTPQILARATSVIAKALQGGAHLDRHDLSARITDAKLDISEGRLVHVLFHAELEQVICSGPRKGKQFTYALMEERVKKTKMLSRNAALAKLARRYFEGHSPATLHDFAWWSGLTLGDAKKGLACVKAELTTFKQGTREYFLLENVKSARISPSAVQMLPNYDEYGIAYKFRDALYDPSDSALVAKHNATPFRHLIVVGGRVKGIWDRTLTTKSVSVTAKPFAKLDAASMKSLELAKQRYVTFLGKSATGTEN